MKCYILIFLYFSTCLQGKIQACFPGFNSTPELLSYAGRYSFSSEEDEETNNLFRASGKYQPQWKIELYPNPAADFIKVIVLSPFKSTLQVELLDLLGNRIKEQQILVNQSLIFDLSDLKPSIYFLRITDTNKQLSITRKVTKINEVYL